MGCLKLTYKDNFLEEPLLNVWKNSERIAREESEKIGFRVNHLGNVLTVVTDRKHQVRGANGMTMGFTAEVMSASDYYPFGMLMPDRNLSSEDYRYGFNGMERDDEVLGSGNFYDFGMRAYNTRLGRMFQIDPRSAEYPWQTTYAYHRDTPVWKIDFMGGGDYYTKEGDKVGSDGKTKEVKTKGKDGKEKTTKVKDDKAYVTTQAAIDANTVNGVTDWDKVISHKDSKTLSVANSTLNKFANTVAKESSGNKQESYALASAIMNLKTHKNKSLARTLSSEGIYGYKDGGNSTSYRNDARYSMEAALNALTGGNDLSNGAIRWDGFDFAAKEIDHVKIRTAGAVIKKEHLETFLAEWTDGFISAYSGGKYKTSSKTLSGGGAFGATEGTHSGGALYKSNAVLGRTIFWGINKNPSTGFGNKEFSNQGLMFLERSKNCSCRDGGGYLRYKYMQSEYIYNRTFNNWNQL